MSSYSGPKITTNGLLVSYDAANNKSFRGQATTNIISNGEFASGLNNWNNYVVSLSSLSVITSSDVPQYLNEDKTLLNCLCPTSAGPGGNYGGVYQFLPTQTAGVTYTISYYARCLVDTMVLKFSFQTGAGDENNLSHSRTITTEWTKYVHTVTLNVSKGVVYISNQNRSGGTFQITDIQLEASPYASSFVFGTRGTTLATGGGLADLSGNDYNAELLNGIGESSDNLGGLILDGTDDYITTDLGAYTPYCIDIWFHNDDPITSAIMEGNYQQLLGVGTAPGGIALGYWTSSAVGETFSFFSSTWNSGGMTYIRDTAQPGIHNLIVNWNGSNYDFWLDGTKRTTYESAYGHCVLQSRTGLDIGRDSGGAYGYEFDGKIYSVKIYNIMLSDENVMQNFNALRSRFGI